MAYAQPDATVTPSTAVRVMPPPAALIVTPALPAGAFAVAVSVNVLDVDPAGIVAGERLAVTPGGRPLAERLTAALNPPLSVNFTDVDAVPPAVTETVAGVVLTWNEGLGVTTSLQ